MNAQQIFDRVLDHLRKQGLASVGNDGGCMYRAPDGAMCAAGCLIADEHYSDSLERRCADQPPVMDAIERSGIDLVHIGLLRDLQIAHDNYLRDYGIDAWEDRMRDIASDRGLSYREREA